MKKILLSTIILIFGLNNANAATVIEDTLMNEINYELAGTFGQHDFAPLNDNDPFDWAFTTANGTVYQLKGEALTEANPFGWLKVDVAVPTPIWYMFQLNGDVDGDGTTKYDWVLLRADMQNKAVYKLEGVTNEGNFKYSNKLYVDYNINHNTIQTGAKGTVESPNDNSGEEAQRQYAITVTPSTPTTSDGQAPCKNAHGSFTITENNEVHGSVLDAWNRTFIVTGVHDETSGKISGGFAYSDNSVATYEGFVQSNSISGTWQDDFGCQGIWQGTPK